MIFRNKALKTTAAAIAIISMVGAGTINYVHADSSLVSQGVAIERTVNNTYDIEYDVIYISPEGDRLEGGQGVDEAKLVLDGTTYKMEVVDAVKYVTVKFKSGMHAAMENYRFKVDGKDAKFELVEGTTSYRIELGENASSEIEAAMYVPAMGRDVKFALVPKGELKTEKKIKDGEYKTTNEVTAHQAQFQNAIRKMANTDSIIKVENGKVSFILGFTPYSHAKDFAAKSGEEVLNITKGIKDENGNEYAIEVDMPSLDADLTIDLTLPYGVFPYDAVLDTSVVEYDEIITQVIPEEDESDNNGSNNNGSSNNESNNNGSSNNGSNNGSNNNGSSNNDSNNGSETEEEKISMEIGKEYKSEFKITGTSETGMNMITRYLDPQAKIVKVSENNYDVTLTFTDSEGKLNVSDLIKNYTIYVNGTKVDCEVISNGTRTVDSVSVKFRIADLNDSIKVGLYVAPMGRDIEFGLDLVATDEQAIVNGTESGATNENEGSGNTGATLPQTGAAIDANMIMGAGAIMMSAGILGRRKRK